MSTVPRRFDGKALGRFTAWSACKSSLKCFCLLAAALTLSACVGTTSSSSSSYNRQLFAKSKFVAPKTINEVKEENALQAPGAEAAQSAPSTAEAADAKAAADEAAVSSGGLIDQFVCTKGLTGDLATARAGQMLLLASGLAVDAEEGGAQAETLSGPLIMAENVSGISPAPSAGAVEAADSSVNALSGKLLGQTEGLLITAYEQTGRRYKSGGQSPATGFDAAGFTRWVYAQRGINLPPDARQQAAAGRQVAKEQLRPGDLLVYRDPSGKSEEYHVGIYTGQGNFLHAVAKSGVVTETAAFGPQYSPYFVGGRRYYDDPKAAPLSDSRKMAAASSAVKLALAELGPNDKPNRSSGRAKPKSNKKKK